MKAVEFCYWLQGMFELGDPSLLNAQQTDLVRRHLSMVFTHEIDLLYPVAQQETLNKLHAGPTVANAGTPAMNDSSVKYRC